MEDTNTTNQVNILQQQKKFLSESDQVSKSMFNYQLTGNKEHRGTY